MNTLFGIHVSPEKPDFCCNFWSIKNINLLWKIRKVPSAQQVAKQAFLAANKQICNTCCHLHFSRTHSYESLIKSTRNFLSEGSSQVRQKKTTMKLEQSLSGTCDKNNQV